ncbi:MAG: serine/threonine-protein phosphatase [Gammaproteobacteria bacterium]|nr:serine/threonine-protein phosphatase [Gammaproteobacteria bacterium]MDH5653184.1 serine/threonine-protein phosphatase [Gammaproteobacteria bacterium]
MQYIVSQASLVGDRSKNQDRVALLEKDQSVLMVLGDGLGGRPGGELAAQTLIDSITRDFNKQAFPVEHPNRFLHELINNAHTAINRLGKVQQPPIKPGTTAVLAFLQEGRLWWTHVGDSRFYLLQHNQPVFRSQDHSVVENLVQNGQITEDKLSEHPLRNVVTRCLGMTDTPPIPTINREIKLRAGDIVLLCSDGFWEPLSEETILKTIYRGKLADALAELAEKATLISAPESDNTSAIALQIMSLQLTQRANPGRSPGTGPI